MSLLRSAPTLAIDLGGTSTRIGIFSAADDMPDITMLAHFPTSPNYNEELARITSIVEQAPHHAGIGVSFGGRITRDGTHIAVARNLPTYERKPLKHDLAAISGGPVRLAHDPICGLLAEKRYGALVSVERCAFLTISTGTGGALQLGKEDLSLTISIEFSHQIVPGNERPCICGQTGCIEMYTGGKQLARIHGRPLEEITDDRVWAELERSLALGLVNLTHLTRVESVALGGAIALNNLNLVPNVQRKVNELIRHADLQVKRAQLGEQAPLVGAGLLLSTPESWILH